MSTMARDNNRRLAPALVSSGKAVANTGHGRLKMPGQVFEKVSSPGIDAAARTVTPIFRQSNPYRKMSPWSKSAAKRLFDIMSVLLVLPLLIPVLVLIALAVGCTSDGPLLFRQTRVGREGRLFTIFKFRTMVQKTQPDRPGITTAANPYFTSVGPFLRRFKLDELPQLINVLRGDMSLVGPRPKLPEHVLYTFPCRPGLTGAATLIFAREEEVLARVPESDLGADYHAVILPAKRRLDSYYMARATFSSDLRILAGTLFRRWDTRFVERLIAKMLYDNHRPLIFQKPVPAFVDSTVRMAFSADCSRTEYGDVQ